jgi:hypothetical protein
MLEADPSRDHPDEAHGYKVRDGEPTHDRAIPGELVLADMHQPAAEADDGAQQDDPRGKGLKRGKT